MAVEFGESANRGDVGAIMKCAVGILAGLITTTCLTPVLAADMKAPVFKAPFVAAPAGSWTGFHIGAQGGVVSSAFTTGSYSWDNNFFDFTGGDATQVFAGVNAGYNQQINNWVWGIEGDLNYKAGHGFYAPLNLEIRSGWDASIRGKLGFLLTPSALIYATGGVAFTSFKTEQATFNNGPNGGTNGEFSGGPDIGSSRVGWTIGGGAEYALDSHWSAKLEYRYTDYGSKSADGSVPSVKFTDQRVAAGLNYNLSAIPVSNRAFAFPASAWTGLYAGVQIGAVASSMSVATSSGIGDFDGPYSAKGGFFQTLAGVHIGYDHQFGDRVVWGVEADINSKSGGGTFDLPSTKSRPQSDYDGSVRARLGYIVTPRTLAYVTGGLAFGHFKTPFHEEDLGDTTQVLGGTRYGWTFGGGLQEQLDSNWSMRIEARYTDWGKKTVDWASPDVDGPISATSKLSDFRVLYGMSYKQLAASPKFANSDLVRANWGGYYVGGQIGSSSAKNRFDDEHNEFTTPFVGANVGYNVMAAANVLFGVEGDLNYKFGHGFGIDDVLRYTSTWDASIRGRIGGFLTARSLLYVTGGYAWGHFKSPSTGADCCSASDYAEEHLGGSRHGWTYGGGIEYALDEKLKTRIEYRHTNWGSKTDGLVGFAEDDRSILSDNRVSLGLTYNFSTPARMLITK